MTVIRTSTTPRTALSVLYGCFEVLKGNCFFILMGALCVVEETQKALNDVGRPCDLRARSDQVRLHAFQPRIITGNANSVEESSLYGSCFLFN